MKVGNNERATIKPDKISGKISVVWSIVQSTTNDIQSVKCYEKEGMTQSWIDGVADKRMLE